jgi:hypothetical protein
MAGALGLRTLAAGNFDEEPSCLVRPAMALEPDAPTQAAGCTVPPDAGNVSLAPPVLDADYDVVVVQDGEDDDADNALTRPCKEGLAPAWRLCVTARGVLTSLLVGQTEKTQVICRLFKSHLNHI